MATIVWGILRGIGGWMWNNKLAALFLALLLSASMSLAVTKIALSTKTVQLKQKEELVKEKDRQITDLKLIQKENEANIVALKQYSDQLASLKQKTILVTEYLSHLPKDVEEVLKSEKICAVNHCIFGYFLDAGMLPDGCYQSEGAVLSKPSKTK